MKLSDFGLASFEDYTCHNNDWMYAPFAAPEVLNKLPYSEKSDVYVFGSHDEPLPVKGVLGFSSGESRGWDLQSCSTPGELMEGIGQFPFGGSSASEFVLTFL